MKTLKAISFALLVSIPISLSAQTPCTDGFAGEYGCSNVDLLAHVTTDELLAEEKDGIILNDIWGWTDPESGKEYAIVGMTNGTSFVDISDPINPIVLGILPEHHSAQSARTGGIQHDGAKSLWRDIKVYKNHAYIVSEDETHGMQVFDLTNLRNVANTPQEFTESGHYNGIGSAHNIVINEASGYAYAVGSNGAANCSEGGLHIINIQSPTSPIYEACFDNDGYTHDAQCVTYNGSDMDYLGKEICFNSNENSITIVNVDDKNNIQLISRNEYEGSSYAHQGWLTEDHNYFLANDELDEFYGGTNTKTYIWDVRDLDAPVLIGKYEHSTTSIDHNLYIVGNKVYESNYTSGLRILDISDIANANLEQIGFFDTYPSDDNPEFHGTWSNYPFFESGVVIVTDITNGLFILKPHYGAFITQHPEDIFACIGDHLNMPISVSGDNITYKWQINTGSGFEDITDYISYNNTNSDTLHIHEVSFAQNQHKFRCKITTPSETYYSNTAIVEITDNPIASFEYLIENNTVQFSNSSAAADSYEWHFGDQSMIDKTESPQHIYDYESLEYEVTLLASNNCSSHDSTQLVNIIVASLDPSDIDKLVDIYPVPASATLKIELKTNENNPVFAIYNLNGKSVLKGTLTKNDRTIDISKLNNGIYLINIYLSNDQVVNKRIIIE